MFCRSAVIFCYFFVQPCLVIQGIVSCSAEDRREYLESLLREPKKEEVALVLDDEALNDILARRFVVFHLVLISYSIVFCSI